ncbi:DNA mismatch repair protein [Halomicroarcula sp. GCM10025709]|uniref:MutS-related protein n=1 Tax=Haloarcula TaxID=2237 RepID=UPI0024C31B9C|nr:DNA mismatch repair protein [Halomicroarcula sp. YJ-61-S]
MRLEEYWGIGPKTAELLSGELGVERAVEAIESADTRTLTTAGLSRGRATRILRRASGAESMELLATRDTREVYKELLDLAEEYAVTPDAADRVRVLTPLPSKESMDERLDDVLSARDTWAALSEEKRDAVVDSFEGYDSGGDRAAVETAIALQAVGVSDGVFGPVAALDSDHLTSARAALAGLAGEGDGVGRGADEELDRLREQLGHVEDLAAGSAEVVEAVQDGAGRPSEFQDALARYVTDETGLARARVREAMPGEATDARDFVETALRELRSGLRADREQRESAVADRLEDDLEAARETVDAAVEAVGDLALSVSLARFAIAFDLVRPTLVEDRETVAVRDARNLTLADVDDPQPITYAVGDHTLDVQSPNAPPSGDRVAVLTGANSGGKTTLLETLCQVQLLAQMGLPVPAEAAEVGVVDTVVFHRRHASFNAGVLESTLRSVVPPLTGGDRALMLVDEFEAITEPGSAADLLHGLVTLTVDRGALGVFVTHLAADLEPLPETARTDGIFAEGLDPDLDLQVDYQPRFGTVGRSTPEFIVSRLVANASDPVERSGFETLAHAVGEEAVQRTLSDARWTDGDGG